MVSSMKYLIWVIGDEDEELYSGKVPGGDAEYLEKIIPLLEPVSRADYVSGLAVILSTAARYSYIQVDDEILWCIEWSPGFIVVKFSPDGQIHGAAVKGLNPCFGGRVATDEELDAFDEDNNPQYNLIFDPWDAQFDEEYRVSENYRLASEDEIQRFQKALEFCGDLEAINDTAFEKSKANIQAWSGSGRVVLP